MKYTTLFAIGCLTLTIAACGGSGSSEKTEDLHAQSTASETTVSAQSPGDDLPGKKLVAMSDCAGCHNKTEKIIGPAYMEIAAKYPADEANISKLADVVIKGSKGTWGDLPMTPHPNLTEADAKLMVTWILSLKQ